MKLAIGGTANVDVTPTVSRFFYVVPDEVVGSDTITIPVAEFWDDLGDDATELPVLAADNSYFQVYINGVLQMEDLSTYTAGGTGTGQLVITVPAGSTVIENSPVVLVVTNFAPTGTLNIET